MTDDTCTFSYVAQQDFSPRTTTGIERSWLDLKLQFGRQGEGLSGAKYYKTTSKLGPELFAVKPDQSVWYHDANKWRRYQTATDVKFEKITSPALDPERKNSTSKLNDNDNDDEVDDPCFGVQDDAELSNNNIRTESNSTFP